MVYTRYIALLFCVIVVEQSAGRFHFVAVDIQETAEDRTVCSELSIALPASDTAFYFSCCTHVLSFLSFLFCKVS